MKLVPMSQADYRRLLDWAYTDYAQAQVQAGAWDAEDAPRLAEEAFRHLLPDGLHTRDQHLYTIQADADDREVGFLWCGLREGEGRRFVVLYEFVIHEPCRRQGYGQAALRALEEKVQQWGMDRILLHVFGHNEAARALYRKMGYVDRNITMAKKLDR